MQIDHHFLTKVTFPYCLNGFSFSSRHPHEFSQRGFLTPSLLCSSLFLFSLQQFGKILDVEIIFNERGSKVSELERQLLHYHVLLLFPNDGISVVCTLAESSGL